MNYQFLMYFHLATVVPCVFFGLFLFIAKKGSKYHRALGKIYMTLMVVTALVTLFMPAHVGPQVLSHFGWIHLFSFLTLYSVPSALIAVRKGNIKKHKRGMISLYVGAIGIAGGFTLVPGRFLHDVFFN